TASSISRGACGSGARTGTTRRTTRRVRSRIRRDLRLGKGGCRAAEVGSTRRNGFGARIDKELTRHGLIRRAASAALRKIKEGQASETGRSCTMASDGGAAHSLSGAGGWTRHSLPAYRSSSRDLHEPRGRAGTTL